MKNRLYRKMNISRDVLSLIYAALHLRRDAVNFRRVCRKWNQVGTLTEPMRKANSTSGCSQSIPQILCDVLDIDKCERAASAECWRCEAVLCEDHNTVCVRCQHVICQKCSLCNVAACLKCVPCCEIGGRPEICSMAGPRGCPNKPTRCVPFYYCKTCDKIFCSMCAQNWHRRHHTK